MTEATTRRILIIATPLIILSLSIALHVGYLEATKPAAEAQSLQLLGYTYNRQMVQLSVTLWNTGRRPLTISGVIYDGVELTRGLVGAPIDANLAGTAQQRSEGILSSKELVFAAAGHWNMDTGGPRSPSVQPMGVVTLYLGITSTDVGSRYTLRIVADGREYAFTLEFQGE